MSARILNLSEATVIALHALRMISESDSCLSSAQIAKIARVSQTHLSKVLRKLVLDGMLSVKKGPAGGFYLTKEQGNASFMRVFELFEGKCVSNNCVFEKGPCGGKECMFGELIKKVNNEFIKYFTKTKISKPKTRK